MGGQHLQSMVKEGSRGKKKKEEGSWELRGGARPWRFKQGDQPG